MVGFFKSSPSFVSKPSENIQTQLLEIIPLTNAPEGKNAAHAVPIKPTAKFEETNIDQWPRLVSEPEVDYPEVAKQAGQEGDVDVILTVDEAGLVIQAKVFKGISETLDLHALKLSSALRFSPAMVRGKPTSVQIKYRFRFELKN